LAQDLGARLDPGRWEMPSVLRLVAALGGLEESEARATFNGGLGMIAVIDPAAADALRAALPDAILVGEVLPSAELGGRYVEGPLQIGG
jgi:phosphoribosylformylglycinamidine cyclo-ligase